MKKEKFMEMLEQAKVDGIFKINQKENKMKK